MQYLCSVHETYNLLKRVYKGLLGFMHTNLWGRTPSESTRTYDLNADFLYSGNTSILCTQVYAHTSYTCVQPFMPMGHCSQQLGFLEAEKSQIKLYATNAPVCLKQLKRIV